MIGLKNRFFGNSLTFNIDAFLNDIDNYQQTSVIETPGYGPGTNTYVINLPSVESKGVELDFSTKVGRWIPSLEGLTIQGNAGFQGGHIGNGKVNRRQLSVNAAGTAGPAGSVVDLTGTPLLRNPSNNFTVRVTYVRALGPDDGKLTATLGYAYITRYSLGNLSPQLPDFQPGYGLLDASLT